jgi:hypothetical protein
MGGPSLGASWAHGGPQLGPIMGPWGAQAWTHHGPMGGLSMFVSIGRDVDVSLRPSFGLVGITGGNP